MKTNIEFNKTFKKGEFLFIFIPTFVFNFNRYDRKKYDEQKRSYRKYKNNNIELGFAFLTFAISLTFEYDSEFEFEKINDL